MSKSLIYKHKHKYLWCSSMVSINE